MSEENLFHVLALLRVEGVGDIMAKKLLTHFGTAENVLNAKSSQLAAIDGVGTVLLKNFKDKTIFEKAKQELDFIQNNNIEVLGFSGRKLPRSFKALY